MSDAAGARFGVTILVSDGQRRYAEERDLAVTDLSDEQKTEAYRADCMARLLASVAITQAELGMLRAQIATLQAELDEGGS